jgi:hypothetical protein
METDRPDQTESPFITKTHFIQAEFGLGWEKDLGYNTLVHPTVLWKYGICSRFEFRLITEYVTVETPIMIPFGNEVETGLLPVQIGGKLALGEEKGLIHKTAFIFHIAPSKLGSKKFHTSKWSPGMRLSFQHTLTDKIGLGYNLGVEWDGETDQPFWIYTLAPGFNIGKNGYAYIEAFGAVRQNDLPQHNVDGGIAYYFSDNSKLDLSSGFGISEAAPDWYVAIGYSIRFSVSKNK